MHRDLTPTELASLRDADESWQIVDVREPWEIEIASLPHSVKIPLAEIPLRLTELDTDRPVAVLCHSGGRSARAAAYLTSRGFSQVVNIAGGIDAWAQEVDNSLPRY